MMTRQQKPRDMWARYCDAMRRSAYLGSEVERRRAQRRARARLEISLASFSAQRKEHQS
jgi:hypothetical protein